VLEQLKQLEGRRQCRYGYKNYAYEELTHIVDTGFSRLWVTSV